MASNRFSRLVKIFTGTHSGDDEELLQLEGRLERFTHFCALVLRQFIRNRCLVRASSLAYTTLLALIPLLAVILSVSTSLLKNVDEDKFYQVIASIAPRTEWPAHEDYSTPPSDEAPSVEIVPNATAETNAVTAAAPTETLAAVPVTTQKEIARWLRDFVQKTQGATLGVTGMVVFVFIAILMLSRVEETFNDIWGVAYGRDWLKRVVLYWTTITLGPLLLLTAASLAGSQHVQVVKDFFQFMPGVGNFIFKLLPLVVLWFTFALVYQIVPNARIKFPAALVGGIVAGTLWHLNNLFGFLYVANVTQNSQIFGKLALVPIFMLGLYLSWVILLLGAQVAYVFQNRAAYLQDRLADNVNQRGREFVALRIMTLLGQRFQNGLRPASLLHLSTELGVPTRLTQQILRTLGAARLVTEVGGTEAAYVPARPLETINAHHILIALRTGSGRDLPAVEAPALAEIYGEFARIEEAERTAAEKISMLDLVLRAPLPPGLVPPKTLTAEKQITAPAAVASTAPVAQVAAPELAEAEPPTSAEPQAPEPEPKKISEDKSPKISQPAPIAAPRRETVQPQESNFPL